MLEPVSREIVAVVAHPIHFRVQNNTGFTVGDIVNTSDVSLLLSPWVAGLI